MTDEELKKKCTERAKIFQQAMESCHSSSPIDCIEWFADSIAELEKENAELKADNDARKFAMAMSEKVEKQLREENSKLKEALEGYKKIVKWCDKCELEKKISVLLSCKNCPENKGGFICQKEYEDKCLAQKIQYIKELQEELKKWKDEWQEQVQEATDEGYARTLQTIQLSKAKQFIRDFLAVAIDYIDPIDKNYSLIAEAEKFINEVEK